MKAVRRLFVLTASCLCLAGCSQRNDAQLASAEAQIQSLAQHVDALEKRIGTVETSRKAALQSTASLTPGSHDYSIVESDIGRFTVSLANVEPFATGSRVTLTFGNITSATINNPRVKVEWGVAAGTASRNGSATRSKDLEFGQSLRPGAWTDIRVVLDDVPPDMLGFVRVSEFTHTSITLRR